MKFPTFNLPAKDKLYHVAAGFAAAVFGALVFSPMVGFLFAILAGLAKELFDLARLKWFNPTGKEIADPDIGDLVATILGGAVGLITVVMFTAAF
jgi:hypothetical protein